jgi:hypothetical protein
MNEDLRPRLSVRRGYQPEFSQETGVPDFLWPYLRTWIGKAVENNENSSKIMLLLSLDLHIDIGNNIPLYGLYSESSYGLCMEPITQFLDNLYSDVNFESGKAELLILDVIDWLLRNDCGSKDALEMILSRAGHELRVSPEGDCLVERIDPVNWNSYGEVVRPADKASRLMQDAWALAFGRDPNPLEAWSDAIKSIETLLKPIVSPDDSKATIGKMIAALRDKPEKWVCSLPDRKYGTKDNKITKRGIEILIDTLNVIGYQPNRHGNETTDAVDDITIRSILFLSVTVLGWLRDGVLAPMK